MLNLACMHNPHVRLLSFKQYLASLDLVSSDVLCSGAIMLYPISSFPDPKYVYANESSLYDDSFDSLCM